MKKIGIVILGLTTTFVSCQEIIEKTEAKIDSTKIEVTEKIEAKVDSSANAIIDSTSSKIEEATKDHLDQAKKILK